jgi:hypothetical protein
VREGLDQRILARTVRLPKRKDSATNTLLVFAQAKKAGSVHQRVGIEKKADGDAFAGGNLASSFLVAMIFRFFSNTLSQN